MRVTSSMMFSAGVKALQSQQQDMMKVQEQSSTGMKINRPSDDPSGTFRHLLFSTDLTGVQSLKRTSALATERLSMGDGKIGSVHESMLQAQELVMRFAHTSVGGDTSLLKNFSTDVAALYEDVLRIANSELDGVPLFGGGRTNLPFDNNNLTATEVRLQQGGKGSLVDPPAWYAFSARLGDVSLGEEAFQPPFDQPEGTTTTSYKISVVAGKYEVEVNGVKDPTPQEATIEEGKQPYINLGNGVLFDLAGTPIEGDEFSFKITPDGEAFKATTVQWQGSGGRTSVNVDGFSTPIDQATEGPTDYRISVIAGQFQVDVNGVRQETLPTVIEEPGRPPYLALTDGLTFNIGQTPKEGDIYSFQVKPMIDGSFQSTQVRMDRSGTVEDHSSHYAGFTAQIEEGRAIADLPLSVKISYLASSQDYVVNINGIDQAPKQLSPGEPPFLDLGNGIRFNVVGQPQLGDVYYFEVVPRYQGGHADRAIQVSNNKTLPGNVTGAELIEGAGTIGRKVNIFGALAALRGAMLRTDPEEVANQLDRILEGGAQASDFQAVTGVRGVQVAATNAILTADEASIQQAKASNSEVDLFEVMSRLQQVSQAMNLMARAEREVLSTSLIDFIR